ncbi:MAG: hypothetical protein JNG88_18580, partial [Phycisphaerales bacterium]|nr:hypothetical protein [Phycisphaerales bacterium]
MKKAVGFRNIVIHNYDAIDWHIVSKGFTSTSKSRVSTMPTFPSVCSPTTTASTTATVVRLPAWPCWPTNVKTGSRTGLAINCSAARSASAFPWSSSST